MKEKKQIAEFEQLVMPHLDAAYSLARWLTRNDHDADDLTQMAVMRAVKFFDGFHGGNPRAWLLTIVRHTFYTNLRDQQHEANDVDFDETLHGDAADSSYAIGSNPEVQLSSRDTDRVVRQALEALPNSFREVIVLKELEELSYKEIADIAGVPIGTVMSRLARGRKMLAEYLQKIGIGGANEVR